MTSSSSSLPSSSDDTSDYKNKRLEEQIKWHSQKARHNKSRFRLYQIIVIFAGAIIPIVNVIDLATRIISSILGGMIAVVTGLSQLEKYQENWILYRTTSELLKKEKYFYENGVGDYLDLDESKKKKLLVERVESIVSSETSKYFIVHQPHLFALTVEVVKKRLLMNAISARLQFLERGPKIEFPSSTDDLIDYVDQNVKDNLDKKDPVYNLFLWSYARQYLAMVIFVAAILVSLLAEWEFIKDFPYEEWAHVIGIAPITLISIIIAVWRYRKSQEWKHFRNLLNKIDKVDKTKIDKSKEEITDSYRKGEISELHYNLLNEKILKMTSKEGTRNNS